MKRTQGFVIALVLFAPSASFADRSNPFSCWSPPVYPRAATCYSAIWCIAVDPCWPAIPGTVPTAAVAKGKYARETTAPPSTTPLDPALFTQPSPNTTAPTRTDLPPAVVVESGPYHDVYPVMPKSGRAAPVEQISAQFWNLTQRDISVTVEGQQRTVPRGKSIAITLGRKFQWRVENRDVETEQIPPGQVGVEIVIRR